MEDVYFARRYNSSKKLKFLKCWMKQIKKSRSCSLMVADKSETNKEVTKEIENRVADLTQESERPIPSFVSLGEESLTGASRIQDDAAFDMCSGTLESFFGDLKKKIQQGLESEGVDLGTLAERLVNSSIYWLYQKHESGNNSQSETLAKKPDDACGTIVAVELTKLLLREPKELINMHKSNDLMIHPLKHLIRGLLKLHQKILLEIEMQHFSLMSSRYELQILFLTEILQSEVRESVEKPMKQKFVKQICLLLEAIQCHLQGGFFGEADLLAYAGKIIKSRYCDTLGNVVNRIYTKMDLLLFADEDESPNHLLNSEDSNQSWRDRQHGDVMGENSCINEPNTARGGQENDNESPQGSKREEHARKVMEAHQRRERAQRFSSFTRVPDLQRVWAPKQSKAMKSNSWKMSNRKDHKRGSYDKVCETPMSRNKRSCPQGSSTDDESHQSYGNHLCGSVSKFVGWLQIHGAVVKVGLDSNLFIGNGLVSMYGKCGCLVEARRVLDEMPSRDVVSWNSMVAGYAQSGRFDDALEVSLLPAVTNTSSENVSYVKEMFLKLDKKNLVSWNVMIAAYVNSSKPTEAVDLYSQMDMQGIEPDAISFASVLPACGDLSALLLGRQIHQYVERKKPRPNLLLENALIDMYAKCGSLAEARAVFDGMQFRDIVSWTSMISAYGMGGKGCDAVALFSKMQNSGLCPDSIAFVSVLSACSHSGLLEEGRYNFKLMTEQYKIIPRIEHFACLVDLLGRAG
ncbi:hypothetical protein LWI29_033567 [Acer saccharum]|uniref:Pentatricopeptide repeat-containing protein n=1 Tax=Acer saccharum TaxID=4024 RepID=A0AA39SXQ8_ACESA|nr:hypothetical protein LWI29_033567 [Acer saccharum]